MSAKRDFDTGVISYLTDMGVDRKVGFKIATELRTEASSLMGWVVKADSAGRNDKKRSGFVPRRLILTLAVTDQTEGGSAASQQTAPGGNANIQTVEIICPTPAKVRVGIALAKENGTFATYSVLKVQYEGERYLPGYFDSLAQAASVPTDETTGEVISNDPDSTADDGTGGSDPKQLPAPEGPDSTP